MKKLTLFATVLGITSLFLIYFIQTPIKISNYQDFLSLQENTLIKTSGEVIQEYFNKNSRTLILDNNISIICPCQGAPTLKNKQIKVLGKLDIYRYPKIQASKISIIS